LGSFSLAVAGGYAVGLGHLILKGGPKVVGGAFTAPRGPLLDGESGFRWTMAFFLVAAVLFVIEKACRWVAEWVAPQHGLVDAWARVMAKRTGPGLLLLVAACASFFLRFDLPSFLVSLPSETRAGGGVGPEIFNTLYFAVLSTVITLPIGVGAAIYLSKFSQSKPFVATVRTALDTLASLPSIVYGLFGFLVFVVQMRAGYSLFAGAFVLALLNLPLIVGVSEEALRAVPRELEDASIALGATRVQTTFRVSVPYAWPGILSALVLSIGRVFAESAPLIMTAGTTISRANAYSLNPFRGGETLAVHLWYVNSAGLSPDRAEVSAGTAAVLVLLIVGTNSLAGYLSRYGGAQGSAPLRRLRGKPAATT
jgi:phosphate transport system permease protein